MKPPLRWALLGSVALHLLLFLPMVKWSLDFEQAPEESLIEARLLPPPAQAKPVAKRAAKPKARTTTSAPAQSGVAAPAPPTPEPAVVEETAAVVPPSRLLPGAGQLVFQVSKGENRFPVGRATHRWNVDGNSYMIRSRIETTGIVALFADVQLEQASTGRIDATGLVPYMFRDMRKGKEYTARFAWDEQQLVLSEDKQLPLAAGAQDLLSMIYQFSLLPLEQGDFSLMITNGRKLLSYAFKVSEDEVTLSDGSTLAAFHLNYQGNDGEGVEVWLARDLARLPVRIRYIDRKGGISELLATEINYQGKE